MWIESEGSLLRDQQQFDPSLCALAFIAMRKNVAFVLGFYKSKSFAPMKSLITINISFSSFEFGIRPLTTTLPVFQTFETPMTQQRNVVTNRECSGLECESRVDNLPLAELKRIIRRKEILMMVELIFSQKGLNLNYGILTNISLNLIL